MIAVEIAVGGEFRSEEDVLGEFDISEEGVSDAVSIEHRSGKSESHVGLLQIETTVVVGGIEIGDSRVEGGTLELIGDVLAKEYSKGTLWGVSLNGVDLRFEIPRSRVDGQLQSCAVFGMCVEGILVLVVFFANMKPIACRDAQIFPLVECREMSIESVGGEINLIACPREISVVGISHEGELARGVPFGSQINSAFVLYVGTFAERLCVKGDVSIAVEALEDHQRQVVLREGKHVERCQSDVAFGSTRSRTDGCFSAET